MQVWFNAPHGPWEPLKSGEEVYSSHHNKPQSYWHDLKCHNKDKLYAQEWYYKTMVTAMDKSMGMLLDALKELKIEENTLVIFTSDNGQEMGAGTAGYFQEGKRSLMVIRYVDIHKHIHMHLDI